MPRRIGFINYKGGVAKTSLVVNVAASPAQAGKRVLLVDLVQVFGTGGSPERYFIMINEPKRERIALELAKLQLEIEDDKKSGFLGRLFDR